MGGSGQPISGGIFALWFVLSREFVVEVEGYPALQVGEGPTRLSLVLGGLGVAILPERLKTAPHTFTQVGLLRLPAACHPLAPRLVGGEEHSYVRHLPSGATPAAGVKSWVHRGGHRSDRGVLVSYGSKLHTLPNMVRAEGGPRRACVKKGSVAQCSPLPTAP